MRVGNDGFIALAPPGDSRAALGSSHRTRDLRERYGLCSPPPVPSRPQSLAPWAYLFLLALCAVAVATHWRVETSITHFLVSPEAAQRGALLRALSESSLARTMVFTVEGDTDEQEVAAADALTESLSDHDGVAWAFAGPDPAIQAAVFQTYFDRRFGFVGTDAEQVAARFDDERLAADARRLRRELASPSGAAIKRIADRDPWLLFVERAEGLMQARAGELDIVGGHFFTTGGQAVVLATSVDPPFGTAATGPLHDFIEAQVARIETETRTEIERSSVHRLAVTSERSIRADIQRISTVSTVAVVLLFLVFLGSPRWLLGAFIPLLSGTLVAAAVGLLVFGSLHALTLAFGATLIGVCVDYPAHLFAHHALGQPSSPRQSLRKVWMGLALGAATTVAGFVGLTGSTFPGIHEIGLFASVGVAAAVCATRWLVPYVMPAHPRVPRVLAFLQRVLARVGHRVGRRKRLWLLPSFAVITMLVGLPRTEWIDDARALNRLSSELLEEDERVRDRVSRADLGRLVVATGADLEAALQRNDALAERLAQTGRERDVQSVHALLWSTDSQRRSAALVAAQPDLAQRTRRALEAEGFRPEAFAALEAELDTEPAPLTFDMLKSTPLEPLVAPFILQLGDEIAVLGFVRPGVELAGLRTDLEGLEDVFVFDQSAFLSQTYRQYRARTLPLLGLGLLAVFALLALRHRSLRRALAAFAPAVLASGTTAAILALQGIPLHLLHLVGLLLVASMGVDYGVFLAEESKAARDDEHTATIVGLTIACLSTMGSFGLLATSSNPALSAVGLTTAIGVALSWVLAPTTSVLLTRRRS